MRIPIIAGNWKMNLGLVEEALAFVRRIRYSLNQIKDVEIVLCPPFTVLSAVSDVLVSTSIRLGAQNMHWEEQGAFTGEISPSMLVAICDTVILGHSERRSGAVVLPEPGSGVIYEEDLAINRKVHAALDHGLTPIICVGENLVQNEAGETGVVVGAQVRAALVGLTASQVSRCILAYEPIWAIGTGRSATPADVNRVIGLTIRGVIAGMFGEITSQSVRVQYGGSVNVENIASFITMPEVDGALVGGASLKMDFVELVRRAANS